MQRPEQALQRQIVKLLETGLPYGWLIHHCANKPRSKVAGRQEKDMGAKKGFPDLIVLGEGSTYFIEVKAEKGRLSPEQSHMRDRLIDLKHPIGIVRSLDDVSDLARQWDWPWRIAA